MFKIDRIKLQGGSYICEFCLVRQRTHPRLRHGVSALPVRHNSGWGHSRAASSAETDASPTNSLLPHEREAREKLMRDTIARLRTTATRAAAEPKVQPATSAQSNSRSGFDASPIKPPPRAAEPVKSNSSGAPTPQSSKKPFTWDAPATTDSRQGKRVFAPRMVSKGGSARKQPLMGPPSHLKVAHRHVPHHHRSRVNGLAANDDFTPAQSHIQSPVAMDEAKPSEPQEPTNPEMPPSQGEESSQPPSRLGWGSFAPASPAESTPLEEYELQSSAFRKPVRVPAKSKSLSGAETAPTPMKSFWEDLEDEPAVVRRPRKSSAATEAPRKPVKSFWEDEAGDESLSGKSWGHLKRRNTNRKEGSTMASADDFWKGLDAMPKDKAAARSSRHREFNAAGHRQDADQSADAQTSQWKGSDRRSERTFAETAPSRRERGSGRFGEDDAEGPAPSRRGGARNARGGRARSSRWDADEEVDDLAEYKREAMRQRKEERRRQKEQNSGPTPIHLPEYISVASLADAMKMSGPRFLASLAELGFEDLTGESIMTGETAGLIAQEYGFEPHVDAGESRDLRPRVVTGDVSALPSRPPIVTIMGHVDHGKTTLLDYLRKSSVAAQEHGGITQHIGAFVVRMPSGKEVTFLDTPGHAAFLSMRQRGANCTDMVVLVVAADDSVMPQTLEALKHARAAGVPIIVAINKCDKPDANPEKVKTDLARHGVEIEDFGGEVQTVCVSGKTGLGMEALEEAVVALAEVIDPRAEREGAAEGWVLESSVKASAGKSATVLVRSGTLREGDCVVAGRTWARVRALRNEAGAEVESAGPGTPVEVLGWRDALPAAGDEVLGAEDEDRAKMAVEYREEMAEREASGREIAAQQAKEREDAARKELEALTAAEGGGDTGTTAEAATPGVKTVTFLVRADTAGSAEAVAALVTELGNHEVRPRLLRSTAGAVTESDVELAALAQPSAIVNFNLPISPAIKRLAAERNVRLMDQSIVYRLQDEVRALLSEQLADKVSTRVLGEADVAQVFAINVRGRVYRNVAGCKVRNGVVRRGDRVRVLRRGETIYDGPIASLMHGKKEVTEMRKGTECGMGFEGFESFEAGDQVQTYEEVREKRYL